MAISSPYARLRLHLLLALGLAAARGFCHACQQSADWADAGDAYRCRHCGADPLEHAPSDMPACAQHAAPSG